MQKRRAYLYCRVSSERQALEGESLAVQRQIGEAICIAEGYELAGVFAEPGISGSVPFAEREKGKALLATVGRGDIIVCLRLDRAFRNSADALNTLALLQKRGIGLYLKDMGGDVSASNVSALVFSLLSSVATFERSRTGERIAEAKCYQRAQGRHMGGAHVAFGFTKVDRREPGATKPKWYLEPIADIHRDARRLRAAGYSLRRAAEAFRAQGHNVSHVGVQALWKAIGVAA